MGGKDESELAVADGQSGTPARPAQGQTIDVAWAARESGRWRLSATRSWGVVGWGMGGTVQGGVLRVRAQAGQKGFGCTTDRESGGGG